MKQLLCEQTSKGIAFLSIFILLNLVAIIIIAARSFIYFFNKKEMQTQMFPITAKRYIFCIDDGWLWASLITTVYVDAIALVALISSLIFKI